VRLVPARGGALRFEDVAERVSPRTRLISLSLVSYKTGAYLPFVPRLAGEAQRVGAMISIDGTQALGRIPVSLEGIDYLMSSSFKWLLGPHGLGIVYVSPRLRERLNPTAIGWYSVPDCHQPDRFEKYQLKQGAACLSSGMPNFPSIYALRRGLEFGLSAGGERVYEGPSPRGESAQRWHRGDGPALELQSPEVLPPLTIHAPQTSVPARHRDA